MYYTNSQKITYKLVNYSNISSSPDESVDSHQSIEYDDADRAGVVHLSSRRK